MCAYDILDRPASSKDEDGSDNDESNPSQAVRGAASTSRVITSSVTNKWPGYAEVAHNHVKPRTKEMEIADREKEARADPSAKRKTRTGIEF